MDIAVLALQGAFLEHEQMIRRLGADTFEIRKAEDWEKPKDGLIIPGGESTTQTKLLRELGLLEPVRKAIVNGLPVWGTCAGLILLADHVVNGVPSGSPAPADGRSSSEESTEAGGMPAPNGMPDSPLSEESTVTGDSPAREPSAGLGTMSIDVCRNAYGRQSGSFFTKGRVDDIGDDVPMTFIRAPYISRVRGNARVLAECGGHIVAARQGNQFVTSFHPELNDDSRVHEYFLRMVRPQ